MDSEMLQAYFQQHDTQSIESKQKTTTKPKRQLKWEASTAQVTVMKYNGAKDETNETKFELSL